MGALLSASPFRYVISSCLPSLCQVGIFYFANEDMKLGHVSWLAAAGLSGTFTNQKHWMFHTQGHRSPPPPPVVVNGEFPERFQGDSCAHLDIIFLLGISEHSNVLCSLLPSVLR